MTRLIPLSVFVLVAAIAPALAQESGDIAAPHQMEALIMLPDSATDATRAYIEAMNTMHAGMMMAFTGDPDVDFIKGMIPHHQGAIDAAKIQLRYGTDPEARAFAEKVIAAQEAEIVWMTTWLRTRGQ
ncbi:MAG: DUF305 domain-containing protein [Rhodobacterales bacterium]